MITTFRARATCVRKLKSGEINKIKALFYNTMIYIWLYGLFNVLKTLYSAFILWFDNFLDSWAEISNLSKNFVVFSENLRHQKEILKLNGL